MTQHFPRIKPQFTIITHSLDVVELRSGVWNQISFTFEDEKKQAKLAEFITMLDGSRSVGEISKLIKLSRSDAESMIDQLNQQGVLEKKATNAFDYYADIYAPLAYSTPQKANTMLKRKIFIIAEEALSTKIKYALEIHAELQTATILSKDDPLIAILQAHDEAWLDDPLQFETKIHQLSAYRESFFILAFDHINPILAKRFNRLATALAIHWIHAALDGPFVFIGPLIEGMVTACYECFETRISMNLREYHAYQKYKLAILKQQIARHGHFPLHHLLQQLMVAHLAMEVTHYILTETCFTKNKVLSIFLPTMEIAFNEFLKLANCEHCGVQVHRDDHQPYFDVQALLKEHQTC